MNHVWVIDFGFDTGVDGRQLECPTVVDEWTHECLETDVTGSIRSGRVVDVLSRPVSLRGGPRQLRCDKGPEILARLEQTCVEVALIDPEKPWQLAAPGSATSASASSGAGTEASDGGHLTPLGLEGGLVGSPGRWWAVELHRSMSAEFHSKSPLAAPIPDFAEVGPSIAVAVSPSFQPFHRQGSPAR